MFKRKYISVDNDLRTGFFSKFLMILGLILLIFYILQKTILLMDIDENLIESIFAFSIIFLGIGCILFFLSRQFSKLAKIAEEIEKEDLFEDGKNSN